MVAFVDAHREAQGIEPICRQLAIAPFDVLPAPAPAGDAERAQRPGATGRRAARRDPARVGRPFPGVRAAQGMEAASA
jgi:hypothetical protein